MNYLSIDEEYTSFYSHEEKKSGEIIQIAIVPVIDGVAEKDKALNQYIRPLTRVWSKGAESVHKISRKRALTFPHPKEAAQNIKNWLEQFDTVFTCMGFNCKGDKLYLQRFVHKWGIAPSWFLRVKPDWLDVKDMAVKRASHLPKSIKLDSLCDFFGIDSQMAHDALHDAVVTSLVKDRLIQLKGNDERIQQSMNDQMTYLEKRHKFLDTKYVMFNGDGDVYISNHATKNPEALRMVLSEIWDIHAEIKE
jgi:DNA polymerase III epsilon subunit-like protein